MIAAMRVNVLFPIILLFLFSCSEQQKGGNYRVEYGDFLQTVTETGELAAVSERSFVMPRFGRYWNEKKIIGLLNHGTQVKAGDSIIQFDPSDVMRFILDRETQLEVQQANLEKIIVEVNNRKSELSSALRSEQAAFDLKTLEVEQFRFESDRAQRVKQLEFEQAQIRLKKVKRSTHHYQIISENQLKIQQIRVSRINYEIQNAYDILPNLTIYTPIPGIFQVATKHRSRDLIELGDQVRTGNRLGNVPDLSWMMVNTVVGETDFMKVHIGQRVNVRLDALPNVAFEGKVKKMSRLCRPIQRDSRRKVFDVEVEIIVSDDRLKPGMTVSCEFLSAELENVYSVPLQCLIREDNRYFVYTESRGNLQKIEVRPGPANNTHVVVSGNIERGQRLVPAYELTTL